MIATQPLPAARGPQPDVASRLTALKARSRASGSSGDGGAADEHGRARERARAAALVARAHELAEARRADWLGESIGVRLAAAHAARMRARAFWGWCEQAAARLHWLRTSRARGQIGRAHV